MLNLPKEVQEAIKAVEWEKISEEIGKKYLLSEDEIATFQLETASFLLGLVDEDLYPENIEDEVGMSREEAKKMADEALEKIFKPVNELIEDNIKRTIRIKSPKWDQTLDFILSGGDYFVFIAEKPREVEFKVPIKPV
jgi:hypothetical protein